MAEKTLAVILRLRDEASAGMKKVSEQLQRQQKEAEKTKKAWEGMQKIGLAMGTAIVGSLTACVVAAEKDRQSQAKLKVAVENAGRSYKYLQDEIEGTIAATARKTGISDEQQRESLSQLIAITGDYETSLKALPVALDLAAFKGIDTASAATILGKALNGNTMQLQRMGIAIDENANSQEVLQAVMERTGGAAEDMANPMTIMKNEIGEVGESIGYILLPALRILTNTITPIIGLVRKVIDNSGTVGKVMVGAAASIGVASLALGAYAAAQQSATVASLAHTIQLGFYTLAHIAGTAATVAGTVARAAGVVVMGAYAVATGVVTAAMTALAGAEAAALAPLVAIGAAVGAIVAIVGAAGYGIYRLADWIAGLGETTKTTVPELERLKGIVVATTTEASNLEDKLEETKTQLGYLADEEDHVKTNMEDAFGVHHKENIERLQTAIENTKGKIEELESAIDSANRELDELRNPSLVGMDALSDAIFENEQKIKKLELEKFEMPITAEIQGIDQQIADLQLKKATLPIGADTTAIDTAIEGLEARKDQLALGYAGIDTQIQALKSEGDALQLKYDTTFDPMIKDLNDSIDLVQGLGSEETFGAVKTRIGELASGIQTAKEQMTGLGEDLIIYQTQLATEMGLYQTNLADIQAEQLVLNNLAYDLGRPGGLIEQATTAEEKAKEEYRRAEEAVQAVYDDMVMIPGQTDIATQSATDWADRLNDAATAANDAGTLADSALSRTKTALQDAVTAWNKATDALNQARAAGVAAGSAQGQVNSLQSSLYSMGSYMSSLQSSMYSSMGFLPHAAEGGIVTRPTVLLAGEAGPEAIVPLDKGMSGTTQYNITIQAGAFVGSRAEADSFANMILGSLRTKQRYAYGAAQF